MANGGGEEGRLTEQLAVRDPFAFVAAYRHHAVALRARARRLVADGDLAEDVVQEVFLRFWSHPGSFDPERGSLRTFLMLRCQNLSIERLRAETSRRHRERREANEPRSARPDGEAIVDLRLAVENLPSHERSPIVLAFYGGMTYRQVAATLGVPEGTTKSHIRSGLSRLRRHLS